MLLYTVELYHMLICHLLFS